MDKLLSGASEEDTENILASNLSLDQGDRLLAFAYRWTASNQLDTTAKPCKRYGKRQTSKSCAASWAWFGSAAIHQTARVHHRAFLASYDRRHRSDLEGRFNNSLFSVCVFSMFLSIRSPFSPFTNENAKHTNTRCDSLQFPSFIYLCMRLHLSLNWILSLAPVSFSNRIAKLTAKHSHFLSCQQIINSTFLSQMAVSTYSLFN